MKATIFFVFVLMNFNVFSGEVTGVGSEVLEVLRSHQIKVADLTNQGMKIVSGEVTGIGKSINLDRIHLLINKKQVFAMNEVSHVEFLHPSEAKTLKDVRHLEFDQKRLAPKQILGVVYK